MVAASSLDTNATDTNNSTTTNTTTNTTTVTTTTNSTTDSTTNATTNATSDEITYVPGVGSIGENNIVKKI